MKTMSNKIRSRIVLGALLIGLGFFEKVQAASWVSTGSMIEGRDYFSLVVLPNGKALAAGGFQYSPPHNAQSTAHCELYDPYTGTWTNTGPMIWPSDTYAETLL